jgi:hypothetical protein
MFPSFVSNWNQCNCPPYVAWLSVTVHVHSWVSINSSQEINRETGATLVDSSYIDSLLCTPDFLRSCTQYENLRFDLDKVLLLYVLRSTRSVTFFLSEF